VREFTKSLNSYLLALSLFGAKQAQNILTPPERGHRKSTATQAFDSVTHATTDQFGETLNSAFRALDNVQRGLVELTFSFLTPFSDRPGSADVEPAPSRSDALGPSEPTRAVDELTTAHAFEHDFRRRD
jgi:hypothetical protein